MSSTYTSAEQLLEQVLDNSYLDDLIGVDELLEPGSGAHGAVYEQISRFHKSIRLCDKNNKMSAKQILMFKCRFVRSMRQLCLSQVDKNAIGLDAHIRAGQATILFIRQDGKWYTKLNRTSNILCVGAYLAACSKRSNAYTYLLYTEDGDQHKD